jgi:DNA-binding response OmpR family regulator
MEPYRVLLIEDDASLGMVLRDHLQMQGFEVVLCEDGLEGLEAFHREDFDLCLVDIMMPKLDGFSFAEDVRTNDRETPLIFLTARSMKEDKIRGFRIGCDDYVTKPFSIEELLLRIEAVLRRSRNHAGSRQQTSFTIGGFTLDTTRQVLVRGKEQRKLTPKENALLHLFCLHRNQTVTREQALKEVWGSDTYFAGRSMDVFVSRLRKYLRDDPNVEILGIHGQGFRLVAPEAD